MCVGIGRRGEFLVGRRCRVSSNGRRLALNPAYPAVRAAGCLPLPRVRSPGLPWFGRTWSVWPRLGWLR